MGFFDNLSKAIGKALGGNKPKKKRGGGGRGNRESSGYARPNKPVKSTQKPQKIKTTVESKPKPDTRFKPKSVSIERGEGITHQIQKIAKTSGIDLDAKQSYDLYKRLDKRIGSDNILSKTGKDTYKISSGKYKGDTGLRRTGKTGLTKDATKTTVNYLERIGKIEKLVKEPKPPKPPVKSEVTKKPKDDKAAQKYKDDLRLKQKLESFNPFIALMNWQSQDEENRIAESKKNRTPQFRNKQDKERKRQSVQVIGALKKSGELDDDTATSVTNIMLGQGDEKDASRYMDHITTNAKRDVQKQLSDGIIDRNRAEMLLTGLEANRSATDITNYRTGANAPAREGIDHVLGSFLGGMVDVIGGAGSGALTIGGLTLKNLGAEGAGQWAVDRGDEVASGYQMAQDLGDISSKQREGENEIIGNLAGAGGSLAASLLLAKGSSAGMGTTAGGTTAAATAFGLSSGGSAARETIEAGGSDLEALLVGGGAGLTEAALEKVGLDRFLKASGPAIARFANRAVSEGLQEFSQSLGTTYWAKIGYDDKTSMDEAVNQAFIEGLYGAALGGGGDIAIETTTKLIEKGVPPKLAEKVAANFEKTVRGENTRKELTGQTKAADMLETIAKKAKTADDFIRNLTPTKLKEMYGNKVPKRLNDAVSELDQLSNDEPTKLNSIRYAKARSVVEKLYEKVKPQEVEQEVQNPSAAPIEQKMGAEPELSPTQQVYEKAYEEDASGTDQEIKAHQYVSQNFDKVMSDYKSRVSKEYKTSTKDNIVSADDAKQVIPGFNAEMSGHYHEPSSSIGKAHYSELLADESTKDQPVLMMAGGSGAGKTVSLSKGKDGGPPVNLDDYSAVIDTNLSSFSSSEKKIQQAKESGRKVQIDYVYRPAELAFQGMMKRGKRINRVVPIDAFVDTHIKSLSTIKELAKRYENDPDVEINVWDNSGGKGEQKYVSLDFLTDKSYNRDELERKLLQDAETAYKSGEITETTYKGIVQRVGETEVSGETGKPQVPDKRQVARPSNKTLAKQIIQNDGITIDLAGNQPSKGYSYSVMPDQETKIPEAEFKKLEVADKAIDDYIDKNFDKLSEPGNHFGAWLEEGFYYLDVSKVGEPSAASIAEAQAAEQLAVYDLETFDPIFIGERTDKGYNKLDEATNIYAKHTGQDQGATESRSEEGNQEAPSSQEVKPLNNLNPTGSLLVGYDPKYRATAPLGKNMVTLDKTQGGSPNDKITIYRGSVSSQKKINPGDYITDMKELAESYTGEGNVLELEVRKGDVIDDSNEPGGNEYIYRPNADRELQPSTPQKVAPTTTESKPKPKITTEKTVSTPALTERVKRDALKKKMIYGFDQRIRNLPETERVDMKDQLQKATEFVLNDTENAIKVAMGIQTPPDGLLRGRVWVAVKEYAENTDNVELMLQLGLESEIPALMKSMGQEIKALDDGSANTPIKAIQSVKEAREKGLEKKQKGGRKKRLIKKETSKLKQTLDSIAPDVSKLNDFISKMEC